MRILFKIDLCWLQVGTFFGRQNKNSTLLLRGVAIFARQKTFFNTLSVLRTFFLIFTTKPFFQHPKLFKYIFWTGFGVTSWSLSCVSSLLLAFALILVFLSC